MPPRSHVKKSPLLLRQNEASSSIELPALPTAPSLARRQTRRVLGEWNLAAEAIETAELLVSELVTNAAKFTGQLPAGLAHPDLAQVGVVTTTLKCTQDQLTIEVSDSDSNPPIATDPVLDSESGRGLMLVEALSKEWSYNFPPAGGKTVYCVISLDDASAARAQA